MNNAEILSNGTDVIKRKDVTQLVQNVKKAVELHCIETGLYARYRDEEHPLPNAYGCADAANLLYTINEFPGNIEERQKWVKGLQNM